MGIVQQFVHVGVEGESEGVRVRVHLPGGPEPVVHEAVDGEGVSVWRAHYLQVHKPVAQQFVHEGVGVYTRLRAWTLGCIYLQVSEPVAQQFVQEGVEGESVQKAEGVDIRVYLPAGLRTCSTTVCT